MRRSLLTEPLIAAFAPLPGFVGALGVVEVGAVGVTPTRRLTDHPPTPHTAYPDTLTTLRGRTGRLIHDEAFPRHP